jgi:hypothetical protein
MNKVVIGKLNAMSVFAAWVLLPSAFIWLGYAKYFGDPEGSALPFIYLFGGFFILVILHLILAYFVRCPNCGKCITAQGFGKPHPDSGGDWSKVVWHWFSGSVACIHCGSKVNTNAL